MDGTQLDQLRAAARWQPRSRVESPARAAVGVAVVAVVAHAALVAQSCRPGPPLSSSAAPIDRPIGFAHVDLMDLHVARADGGALNHREILSPEQLRERSIVAAQAGAGWDRWSLYWDMVETPSGMDWSVVDEMVARDVEAGLSSLAILQGTPPVYATGGVAGATYPTTGGGTTARNELIAKADAAPQASPPSGLDQPVFVTSSGQLTDDPQRADHVNPANPWARFVDASVGRYKPGGDLAAARGWRADAGVTAWEIGNEPNLRHFWSGTTRQFVRYLEVAYLVVERRDPAARVVHGGIADDASAPAWFRSFLAELRAAGERSELPERYGYYFDASAWHWYAYPDLLRTGPVRARGLLREVGLEAKPLWVTEFGAPIWSEYPGPCWDATSPWRSTVTEQAGYFWQALAEGMSSRLELFTAFQLYDDCGNGPTSYDAFGTVRNLSGNHCWIPPEGQSCWVHDPSMDGVARPAHAALATVAGLLPAQPLERPAREPGGWQRVVFYGPPDRRITFAWNYGRQSVEAAIRATGPEAELFTLSASGVRRAIEHPTGGDLHFALPGATNRNDPSGASLMAGLPTIVVERDSIPPFETSIRAPAADGDGSFDVTVTASDGGVGVSRVEIYDAYGAEPDSPDDWRLVQTADWLGPVLSGEMTISVTARQEGFMYLAARAVDRAGNATAMPTRGQATILIGDATPAPRVAVVHLPASYNRQSLPGHEATPIPPSPTATRPVATATAPASATDRPATSTPAPPTPRATSSPGPTPSCTPVTVLVTGPRDDPLPPGSGSWVLRAYEAEGSPPDVSEAPIGTAACVGFAAARMEAVALAPGYAAFPPQDLALSSHLALAVAPGFIVNGGFEAGLAGWTPGGEAPPVQVRDALAGAGAARLGDEASGLDGPNSASISQEIDVSGLQSTLGYSFRYEAQPTCGGGGCSLDDRFDVLATDLDAPGRPVTVLTGSDGVRDREEKWVHSWHDLSRWSGRRVLVTFMLRQSDGVDPSRLWLDNVSAGPARP